jgi:hypothetical protein
MNKYIGLVFPGQAFGLTDSGALFAVFARDPLVSFTAYGPTYFVRYHMLVPRSSAFASLYAVEKDL